MQFWHKAIEKKDLSIISPVVSDEVTLISPALYKPKVGKPVVMALLNDVAASINDYKISKTWISGNEILLEFDATVRNKKIQGIDKITLNEQGQMVNLKVFIRPFSGLQALISSIVSLELGRALLKMNSYQRLWFKIRYRSRLKSV